MWSNVHQDNNTMLVCCQLAELIIILQSQHKIKYVVDITFLQKKFSIFAHMM